MFYFSHFGKLFQSILGYDLILNNCEIDPYYINEMKEYFILKCMNYGLNIEYLRYVTKSLIFGTFHFFSTNVSLETKENIWRFIKNHKSTVIKNNWFS